MPNSAQPLNLMQQLETMLLTTAYNFFGSIIFTLRWMLWVSVKYVIRYATRIFIAKIIFVTLKRLGQLNTMVPFAFITMAFGFDQHPNKLKDLIFFLG